MTKDQLNVHIQTEICIVARRSGFLCMTRRKENCGKCDRALILQGCEMLEMDVKDVAGIVISGMKEHAEELELMGTQDSDV